ICTNVWTADYKVTARDDCDTNVTLVCNPPNGAPLPPGNHNVTCMARDDCGNISGCQFQVRVIRDTTPPVLDCPSNLVFRTCYDRERIVSRVTARDDCDTNVTIVCNPPSGTNFPVGTNEVRCVATDDCGNRSECRFFVILIKEPPPKLTIRKLVGAPGWVICWPKPSTGFRLQCTRSLHPPILWETVTNAPVMVNTQWCVTLPNIPPHRFYRLCKPPRPNITSVKPLDPRPGEVVFIQGTDFIGDPNEMGNPDDYCVAIAVPPMVPMMTDDNAELGGPDTMILLPLRALSVSDMLLTARMPPALPPEMMMGHIMVGAGMGQAGMFQPIFPDIHVLQDVWTWTKGDSDGMGEDQVQPQPEPPAPNECWFFSGEPVNCR
ncbi:MAG: HYR domain-containing protein, partial [Phycisphaerales bacterium]|nr:HYR domain-containing protein [Phycisphaerales bacterium]